MSGNTGRISYARFRAALDAGQLEWIRAHAKSSAPIPLPAALEICLLVRDQDPERHDRPIAVWLGRFALDASSVGLTDLREAMEASALLAGEPLEAKEALAGLCARHRVGR